MYGQSVNWTDEMQRTASKKNFEGFKAAE